MDEDEIRAKVLSLGPWRHDIDLGPFSTFDVGKSVGPFAKLGHPEPRYQFGRLFMPDPPASVLDVGCNAGGVSFRAEADGYGPVMGVDSGVDPGLRVPNPDLFDDDTSETRGFWSTSPGPLKQAEFCKEVRDSDARFFEFDAVNDDVSEMFAADLVLAYGILYHVHKAVEDRDRRAVEEAFLDDLFEMAHRRVLIETAIETDSGYSYDWVAEYLDDQGHQVQMVAGPGMDVPGGVRHFIAADVVR